MKGLSMPVNLTIVVIVAVIILLAIIMIIFYFRGQTPTNEALYRVACLSLIKDCSQSLDAVTVESGGKTYTLGQLCSEMNIWEDSCRKGCGCDIV